jgi:hypothetical protein
VIVWACYTEETGADNKPVFVPGPVILLGDGEPLIEDLCTTCIDASYINRTAEYYDGCWNDKHCHPSHIVESKPEDYLV